MRIILAALACGPPARTPTLEPGVLETAVAETVQAQLATGEPTNTPGYANTARHPPHSHLDSRPHSYTYPHLHPHGDADRDTSTLRHCHRAGV